MALAAHAMKNKKITHFIENIINKNGNKYCWKENLIKTPWRNIKMIILDSNFVLGNAVAPPDYPIVYCSDGFCELTGIYLFVD